MEVNMAGDSLMQESTVGIARALALTTQAVDVLDAHGGSQQAATLIDLARRELTEVLAAIGGGLDPLWAVNIRLNGYE
jgi:hypothetical protein